jgi:DNA-binding NarL/FixJ family response regulator
VILADDHPMMLEGLKKLLEPDFEVVATATDGQVLLEAAKTLRPDLVIADISMPEIDGVEATRRLRPTVPGVRVLILSIHTEPSWVREAFEAGACGYLTKGSAPEEIERAAREVLAGRFFVSPVVARAAVVPARDPPAAVWREDRGEPVLPGELGPRQAGALPATRETLTPREVEIVHLVGQGMGNKEIARRLGVAVTTVRTHLASAYHRLGLASRVELALYAVRAEVGATQS